MRNSSGQIAEPAGEPDKNWRHLFRASAKLGLGGLWQSLCSIAYLALATRALGIETFGFLILIHGMSLMFAGLARFQTWEVVVRFGSRPTLKYDTQLLQIILQNATFVDLAGVLFATGLTLGLGPAAFAWFELPPEMTNQALLYSVAAVVCLNGSGTATGVLRLFERFTFLSLQSALQPTLRLLGAIGLFYADAGLSAFLVLWWIALASGRVALVLGALHHLARHGWLRPRRPPDRSVLNPAPGYWTFALGTHLLGSNQLFRKHGPTLLAGGLFGPYAAGAYRVARQFSDFLLLWSTKLVRPAFYPLVMRLTAQSAFTERLRLLLRLGRVLLTVSLAALALLALAGPRLIQAVTGEARADIYGLVLWLGTAAVIRGVAFVCSPLLLAEKRVGSVVRAEFLASAIHLLGLTFLAAPLGLAALGVAALAAGILESGLLLHAARRHLKRHESALP